MDYQVLWTETARQDLHEIVQYIAQDNIDSALAVLEKLQHKAEELQTFPDRGRIPPELADTGISHYREIIAPPWRIIYRSQSTLVFVTAVLDSRRNLQTILLNRLAR